MTCQSYKCPVSQCLKGAALPKTRCIESNYELPQQQFQRFGHCPGTKVCNYKPSSSYLWPLSPSDLASRTDISTSDLWGYCTESDSWEIGSLLPGRSCTQDFECFSNLCGTNGKCVGLKFPEVCRDHRDCEVG